MTRALVHGRNVRQLRGEGRRLNPKQLKIKVKQRLWKEPKKLKINLSELQVSRLEKEGRGGTIDEATILIKERPLSTSNKIRVELATTGTLAELCINKMNLSCVFVCLYILCDLSSTFTHTHTNTQT